MMRFEFYSDEIAAVPKLSVDGTVDNAIHFSHWKGNETPQSVKADTSTETVLNVVAAPNRQELTRSIELDRKQSMPHYHLARVYDRLGQPERAKAEREAHERLTTPTPR